MVSLIVNNDNMFRHEWNDNSNNNNNNNNDAHSVHQDTPREGRKTSLELCLPHTTHFSIQLWQTFDRLQI